jgi:plasmid stabilization system protein ParE
MEVEWSPLAIDRVIDIAGHIALDKPDVAMQWLVIYLIQQKN